MNFLYGSYHPKWFQDIPLWNSQVTLWDDTTQTWDAFGPITNPNLLMPRWVSQTNSNQPNSDRCNWITQDFTLGSASADYSTVDKLINLELGSSSTGRMNPIIVVMDQFDSPYGEVVTNEGGHLKSSHLPLTPACVQKRGMLL